MVGFKEVTMRVFAVFLGFLCIAGALLAIRYSRSVPTADATPSPEASVPDYRTPERHAEAPTSTPIPAPQSGYVASTGESDDLRSRLEELEEENQQLKRKLEEYVEKASSIGSEFENLKRSLDSVGSTVDEFSYGENWRDVVPKLEANWSAAEIGLQSLESEVDSLAGID